MNGYTYADGNPVMNTDPDGHWAWAVVNAGFAVYDGYKAYKAGKSKKQIAWAVASSFVKVGHIKKVGKALKLLPKYKRKPIAGKITGYSKHGLAQAIARDGRGVSPQAILDTVRNPKKVIHQKDRKVYRYEGKKSIVVLNYKGKIVTTMARGKGNTRVKKRR